MKISVIRSLLLFLFIGVLAACSNSGGDNDDNNSKTSADQGQWNTMIWGEDNWQ